MFLCVNGELACRVLANDPITDVAIYLPKYMGNMVKSTGPHMSL